VNHSGRTAPYSRQRAAKGLLAWAVLIAVLSILPIPQPDAARRFSMSDTVAHAVFYVPLGALCLWALWDGSRGKVLVKAVAAATLYGVLLELFQAGLPWRSFEMADMAADLAGSGAGAGLALFLPRRKASVR